MTYWEQARRYYFLSDNELRRKSQGSKDAKIDNIRKMRGTLSRKQRWCLAFHLMERDQEERAKG